jgi:YD repeat-containing protein
MIVSLRRSAGDVKAARALFKATRLSNALNFSGSSSPIALNCTTTSAISRSHNAVIRVYDDAGNLIETHDHAGDFKEP